MLLWKKVLLGLILGVFLGFILGDKVVYLKPFGDLFIRLIKMVIVPVIFFAIVGGITSAENSKAIGRVGFKASLAYIGTTIFAVLIGLTVGTLLKPGSGLKLDFSEKFTQIPEGNNLGRILETLLEIVPDNAIGAMAQGAILQVVFFALFTGITINKLEKTDFNQIRDFIAILSKLVFKMVNLIIQLSPIAACALTAWVIGTQGAEILVNLAAVIFCAYFAFAIQYVFFGVMIKVFTGLSPKPFFKKSFEYQAIAFSTSSSKAALPTTIDVCHKKIGISKFSSSFVLPLGASINMDGIAIYISICALFFAQATGKVLGFGDYGLIAFMATLGSIGGAGIPSGTIVMLPMVLGAVGLPLDGIALIVGVDRIIDMMRTTISITGDAAVTLCIDHSEGTLNEEKYYKLDLV
ncbi:MAG: dicarboxylate/amino acid:cation symporter [Pseudomonadota bacterium]